MADLTIVPDTGDTLSAGRDAKPLEDGIFTGRLRSATTVRRATAGENLSASRAVRLDSAGAVRYADAGTAAHAGQVAGLTRTAASSSDEVDVIEAGIVDDPEWTWTPGAPIFAGASGALTQTAPSAPTSAWSCVVAIAITDTRVRVGIGNAIVLA